MPHCLPKAEVGERAAVPIIEVGKQRVNVRDCRIYTHLLHNVKLILKFVLFLSMYGGVHIAEGVQVQKILTDRGHVSAIQTSHGTVKCKYFVNCGGQVLQ